MAKERDFGNYSKVETRCFLARTDTKEIWYFQYNPESMPYGRSAKFATIDSPGMSYPLTQYVGGDVREFSFEVFYYDRPFTGHINAARKFLRSLLPPEKNRKKFKKPPTFMLCYGYFCRTCVLKDLQINDKWLDEKGRPIMTSFTLTVRQVGT